MLVLGYNLSYLELFASIISFVGIVLATKANIWSWFFSIIGQVFFFILFMNNGLYGNMSLQIFFTFISFYGWYYWDRDIGKKIKTLEKKKIIIGSILTIVSCFIGSWILGFFETENVLLDSTTTILSIIAVYLLSEKYLESWILWLIVDILSIFLFYLKGMNFISIEYVFITGVATYGLINWIKLYKEQ